MIDLSHGIKGGQGRTATEVERTGSMLGLMLIGALVFLAGFGLGVWL